MLPSLARADAVDDWNVHATTAILASAPTAHGSTISWAMVQGAVYDAVNAIDGGHEGYLLTSRLATPFDSKDAAAATAAYRVLLNLTPAQEPVLDAHYAASLAMVPDGSAGDARDRRRRGRGSGDARRARRTTVAIGPFTFVIGTEPGDWRPLTADWRSTPPRGSADVRPFLIDERLAVPLGRAVPAHEQGLREGLQRGEASSARSTSTTRTADQTRAAIFWQAQPMALWGGVLRVALGALRLDTADKARLLGMVAPRGGRRARSAAGTTSTTGTSGGRSTAIREADTDGNRGHRGRPELAAAVRPGDARRRRRSVDAALPRPSLRATAASAVPS